MSERTFQEQIVREAPDIEAYKIGLLRSAKGLSDQPVALPGYSIAGFNPDQLAAFQQARAGIGAYQPYLYGGSQALQQGVGTTQEAADVLRGADTRAQFQAAQQALNLSGQTAGQIGQAAQNLNPAFQNLGAAGQYARGSDTSGMFPGAYSFIGQGAGLTGRAAQQALGSSAADYAPAMGLMGAGINQLYGGTGQYDPRSVSAFMDPYQRQVIDAATQEINRQRDIAEQQQNAQAVGAGAFGGSRQAIQRAELERNTAQLRNQTIAGLMSQGYNQAQAQAQAAFEAGRQRDIATGQAIGQQAGLAGQLATQQAQLGQSGAGLAGQLGGQMGQFGTQVGQLAGQQAGIQQNIANLLAQQAQAGGQLAGQQANIFAQQAGMYGNVGQGIGQLAGQQYGVGQNMAQSLAGMGAQLGNLGVQQAALGQTAQQLGQQDVNFLYNIGQQQQGLTQQQLDAQRNTALQQAYEPYQRLAFLSDIYKGAPSSQQSISAATAPTPSAFQQAAGLGIAGLSAGTAAKRAGLF